VSVIQQIEIKYYQNKLLNLADIKLSQHTYQHTFYFIPIMHRIVNTFFSLTRSVNMYSIARSAKQPELLLADELFYSGGSK